MPRTFSPENGSFDISKLLERCGRPGGLRGRVALINGAISSSLVLRGRPGFNSLCSLPRDYHWQNEYDALTDRHVAELLRERASR